MIMETKESFIPYVGKIIDIKQETPDVKTNYAEGLYIRSFLLNVNNFSYIRNE